MNDLVYQKPSGSQYILNLPVQALQKPNKGNFYILVGLKWLIYPLQNRVASRRGTIENMIIHNRFKIGCTYMITK